METKSCSVCSEEKPINEFYPNYSSRGYKTFCKRCQNTKRRYNVVANMLSNAKRRSKDDSLEFDLDIGFLLELKEKQQNLCNLTGWAMNWEASYSGKRVCPPDRASIDRIDSSKGYTKDNIQLVVDMANRIKSNYPQDLFVKLCKDVARRFNVENS